jgi:CelD/BcsL family acetyltransferase involved in cellulose biosynthesis
MEQGMTQTAAHRPERAKRVEGERAKRVEGLALAAPPRTAAPSAASALTVEIRTSLLFTVDEHVAVERMLSARPELAVFLSRHWLSGFFDDPPPGAEPEVVIIRQGHLIRGMVPIAVFKTFTHARIGLLGGSYGSDRVDLIATRGFEAATADAFIGWLSSVYGPEGFLFELRDVPSTSPLWGAIHRASAEGRLRGVLQPREIATLPYLDLKERPSTVSAASPPATSVRSLEKHQRWLERRCQLRIDLLVDPAEVTDAFRALVSFLHTRWQGTAAGSALDDDRTRRFHENALLRLLDGGYLRMIRLADGVRPIAVFYGLASGTWWGYYLCGYDREWAGRIHLGQLALQTAMDIARSEGAAEFDFLKGAHRNKYAWPVRERTTVDADLFSGDPAAQLTRAARAARDVAAAVRKAGRQLMSW